MKYLLLSSLLWCGLSMAAEPVAVPPSTSTPAAPLAQSPAAALLARPVTLRGKLAEQPIQMHLRLKAQAEEGIEGEYFLFGRTQKVLLAGEADNNTLTMEESENGTDISGQWDGRIEGNVVRGTWTAADNVTIKPFELSVIRDAAVAEKKPRQKSQRSKTLATRPIPSTMK
jgi:hypothetical protein